MMKISRLRVMLMRGRWRCWSHGGAGGSRTRVGFADAAVLCCAVLCCPQFWRELSDVMLCCAVLCCAVVMLGHMVVIGAMTDPHT